MQTIADFVLASVYPGSFRNLYLMWVYPIYIWCECIQSISDVSLSSLYLMWVYPFFIWCECIQSISDVSVSSLYLMWVYPVYIWCECIHSLSDVSVSNLYLMWVYPIYFWCECIQSISDVSVSSLHLMWVYPICIWCECIQSVSDVSVSNPTSQFWCLHQCCSSYGIATCTFLSSYCSTCLQPYWSWISLVYHFSLYLSIYSSASSPYQKDVLPFGAEVLVATSQLLAKTESY